YVGPFDGEMCAPGTRSSRGHTGGLDDVGGGELGCEELGGRLLVGGGGGQEHPGGGLAGLRLPLAEPAENLLADAARELSLENLGEHERVLERLAGLRPVDDGDGGTDGVGDPEVGGDALDDLDGFDHEQAPLQGCPLDTGGGRG